MFCDILFTLQQLVLLHTIILHYDYYWVPHGSSSCCCGGVIVVEVVVIVLAIVVIDAGVDDVINNAIRGNEGGGGGGDGADGAVIAAVVATFCWAPWTRRCCKNYQRSLFPTFCVFQEELAQQAVYDKGGHGEGVTDSTTDDNTDGITDDNADGATDGDGGRNADQVIFFLCYQCFEESKQSIFVVDQRLRRDRRRSR